MKNTFFTILLIFGILSNNVNAQIILKKKEVNEKLILISSEIGNKNYEDAMDILFNKENVILPENVKGKDTEQYNSVKKILNTKRVEFDNTNSKVLTLIKTFQSLNFDKAFELIKISLTKENSYYKTQKTQTDILPQLKKSKQICEQNKRNILKWKQDFKDQNFEKIFTIIDLENSLTDCFYKADLIDLEKLQKELKPIFQIYKSVKDITITKPLTTLNSINYSYLDYEKSENHIKKLNAYISNFKIEQNKVLGNNPQLTREISDTKLKIEVELIKLKKYSESNRPLSQNELNAFVNNGSKQITIAQIEKYFTPIDEDDVWNLGNTYNLDVVRYYNLKEYDTDLKKEVFKETSEYSTKLSELKQKKAEIRNTMYSLVLNGGSYDNDRMLTEGGSGGKYPVEYDISKGGFNINIGAFNLAMGGLPKVYREKFEFKSIPIKKIQAYNEYGQLYDDYSFYRQMAFFAMDKSTGLKFEKNKENIEIIALFKVNKINIRKVLRISYYDYWYIVSALKVRVIAYNKLTNEIYYDKLY